MELILEKSVSKEMFLKFTEAFFSSWKNDEKKDNEQVSNQGFLDFLPKNVMWEIKPLAEKQQKKILKALETAKEEDLTKIFDELAESLACEFWEKELKEVNVQMLPNFAFCQVAYREVVSHGGVALSTFSRLFMGAATDVLKIHPDPFID